MKHKALSAHGPLGQSSQKVQKIKVKAEVNLLPITTTHKVAVQFLDLKNGLHFSEVFVESVKLYYNLFWKILPQTQNSDESENTIKTSTMLFLTFKSVKKHIFTYILKTESNLVIS